MQNDIFKDIPDYEGSYQISNLSNVKSLKRQIPTMGGYRIIKERMLKQSLNLSGYLIVGLSKKGKIKTFDVHILMAIVFKNHKRNGYKNLIVDHKDNIKTNNFESNIQLVTHRENCSKDKFRKNPTSKLTGVCWDKQMNKWRSSIRIKGKCKFLGLYETESQASNKYQNELINL